MKTTSNPHPLKVRILNGLLAVSCLVAAPSAFADEPIGQVYISLNGQVLKNGADISVDSGSKRIEQSKLYSYEFSGKVRGKKGTPAADFVPNGTSVSDFLESLSPGSSKFLKGEFSNPSGTLPITVVDRKISGKRKVPGLGKVKVALRMLGKITADGTCELEITEVKIKSSKINDLGAIEYMRGSKLVVAAAPEVTFLKTATTVDENAGTVSVAVRRLINFRDTVSVNFTTVPDTADSSDFTPTSGTVTFAPHENSKLITIPLIDNALNDGVRRFNIEISNPSAGAFLGAGVTTKIVILDDE